IAAALPHQARTFYLNHLSPLDLFILGLGTFLFVIQVGLAWRARRWRGGGVDRGADAPPEKPGQGARGGPPPGRGGGGGGVVEARSEVWSTRSSGGGIGGGGGGWLVPVLTSLPVGGVLTGGGLMGGGGGREGGGAVGRVRAPPAGPPAPRPGEAGR